MGTSRSGAIGGRAEARAALALLGAACLAACGGATPARRAGTLNARRRAPAPVEAPGAACAELDPSELPRACVVARFDAASGVMEVQLSIEPSALPEGRREVRLVWASAGHAAAVERIEADGAPATDAWPESLGALPTPLELRYRVRLDADAAPEGRRQASFRRPGGWHLAGASFLPELVVDGEPATIRTTLLLDVGDETLFTAAGTEQRVFDADGLRRLANEGYEIGPLTTTRREVRSTVLWVGTSGDEGVGRLEATADALEQLIERMSARLGPPSTDALLVTFHPLGSGWAERLGASVVLARGLPADPIYGLAEAAAHELGHLWIPGTHDITEAWLAEGITEYLALRTLEAMTDADPEPIARLLSRRHASYAGAAGERTLLDPDPERPGWIVEAGLGAGFCLDTHLRDAGTALWPVLAGVLDRDEREVGTEALLADLSALSGSSASYLEALVSSRGAYAIDACLERAGFAASETTFTGLSDEALLGSLLGVESIEGERLVVGLAVREASEGSALEAGDVLTRLAGRSVGALEDAAWAVRELEEGDAVPAVVWRRGDARTLELLMPSLEGAVERRYVELSPVDR